MKNSEVTNVLDCLIEARYTLLVIAAQYVGITHNSYESKIEYDTATLLIKKGYLEVKNKKLRIPTS